MLHIECSLQSRRNFGERVLIIFLTEIIAAIFNYNGSGRLGGERNFHKRGGRRSIIRRGVGVGEWRLRLPEVIIILQNSTRPRTEFLIALLSHHARITRAALATSEIQDKVQDIAYDIQGHSWPGSYLYHGFGFSEEEIPIILEVKWGVVLNSTFLRVEEDVTSGNSLYLGRTHVME